MLIMEDREKPGPQIGSRLPEMLLRESAYETALHEVVRARRIPSKCPGVTTQSRNLVFEKSSEVAHDITHRSSSLRQASGCSMTLLRKEEVAIS